MKEQTSNRLSFWWSLRYSLIAWIAFLVALGFGTRMATNELDHVILSARQEKYGNEYNSVLFDFVSQVQEMRGMYYVHGRDDAIFKVYLRAKINELNMAIGSLMEVDAKYNEDLDSSRMVKVLKADYDRLKESVESDSFDASVNSYNRFIDDSYALMFHVGNTSHLITDPELDTYYLMNLNLNVIPFLVEEIDQMRSAVVGATADEKLFEKERFSLLIAYGGLVDYEKQFIRSIKSIYTENPEIKDLILPYVDAFEFTYEEFLEACEPLLVEGQFELASSSFFNLGTDLLDDLTALYLACSNRLDVLIEERIVKKTQKRRNVVAGSFGLAFLSLLLYAFYCRNALKRLRAEGQLRQTLEDLELRVEERTEELRVARDAAEASTAIKSEFLANMSHEIRTPMNGVIGMINLLLESKLDEKQKHYAETVRSCGESLLVIINDILDFSKIEAGKLSFETIDFDLHDLLFDLGKLLSVRAEEKQLEFLIMTDPNVPSSLRGDPGRIRQILNNLSGNALKFTQEGEVCVRASLISKSDEQVQVRFSIRDTGVGIPEDKQSSLFDKFTQVDSSVTRNFGGTGLGLAISKQLVELLGGQIGCSSKEGEGSEFWFEIPLARQTDSIDRNRSDRFMRRRALVVDDNATNREILQIHLENWGFEVSEASDAQSGLDLMQGAVTGKQPYDICVLDMMMPQMDGLEMGRLIRSDSSLRAVPLILLTSMGQSQCVDEAEAIGFSACLSKPTNHSQLFDEFVKVLDTGVPGKSQGADADRGLDSIQVVNPNARLLLVEDNSVNQQVALGILKEQLGLDSDVAANGLEALEALSQKSYDLVFMDMQMPKMDGLEATRQIRSGKIEGVDATVPIVAMTANAMDADRKKCLEAGMLDYMSKPIEVKRLASMINQYTLGSQSVEVVDEPVQAKPSLSNIAYLDPEHLSFFKQETLEGILTGFGNSFDEQHQLIRRAVAEHDIEALKEALHAIKGASMNLGMLRLSEAIIEMEKRAKSEAAFPASEAIEHLQTLAEETLEAFRQGKLVGPDFSWYRRGK